MASGSALERHEGLQTIPPVGGGRQPEPPSAVCLAHARFERDSRHVVALVDDDQPVPTEQCRRLVSASDALDHGDVDSSGRLVLTTADDAHLGPIHSQVLDQAVPPLVDQLGAIDEYERRHVMVRDHRARHDRLADSGRSHDHAPFMGDRGLHRPGLFRPEVPGEVEADRRVPGSDIGEIESTAEVRDQVDHPFH